MTLRDLLRVLAGDGLSRTGAPPSAGDAALDRAWSGLAYDSRRVSAGDVFVAIKGERHDGADFADSAIAGGATAIVSERAAPEPAPAPWIQVSDARLALAVLSSWHFGHPSRDLLVVGITGTNGKTTASYLVRAILERAGYPCGLIGTVQYSIGAELLEAPRTTPESLDLQELFARMRTAGARACCMEVSSHALALRRVDGTRFAAGVFTNLTRDHLDFHGDMDAYFAAKRRLFDLLPSGAPAVVNVDDPRGQALAAEVPAAVTYGLSPSAHVRAEGVSPSLAGVAFEAVTPPGTFPIRSRLVGRFNLYNLLSAVATGVALGVPAAAIQDGLGSVSAVPGRFQLVSDAADDVTAIVDYAHTDDALKNLLEAVRPLACGRLITVFGCGGDRDRTKRPLMGAVAARLSDLVVLTSDNPRSEDPDRIIDEIELGIAPAGQRARAADGAGGSRNGHPGEAPRWLRIADRAAAITHAVEHADPNDVVVVAGKGHEKYQVVGSRVLPFDDVDVVRAALARRRSLRVA
jgi:UDP-N-acetylmuramoyl-L-alanyl-D-glutamate--2,6-diaminopimelate ligase